MDVNILVRGQSNAILMMEAGGYAGQAALQAEVSRLLGFDGTTDRVNIVYDRFDWNSGTAFGGTALIGDWLTPRNNDWRQGWTIAGREQALLNEIASLPASQRDDPTVVLWLHSEYDSANTSLTAEEWVSAVRHDAGLVRAALGQGAGTVPYLFISAMPYYGTTDGHNAIRIGMEALVADAGFNAAMAARMIDIDADGDSAGAYGGGHIDEQDALQTAMRSARAVAEALAPYAKAGSPVAAAGGDIADEGPRVVTATAAGTDQLRLDVAHDRAGGFQALDADAARGVGWSVHGGSGTVEGRAVSIVDGDTLLVTFSGPLPANGVLHYGYGYGRLWGAAGSGRGNAVYDDQGLPIWVPAQGLALGSTGGGGTAPAPVVPEAGRLVNGTAGADDLRGGAGSDTLNGAAGSDDLQGFDGDDRLAGGPGADGLTLGAGADTVVFARGDGSDWIVDFTPGTDGIAITGYAASEATIRQATYWGMAGTDIVLAGGDSLFLQGVTNFRASDVTWSGGSTAPVAPPPAPTTGLLVDGGSGVDNLRGGEGADTLNGLAGADDLQGFDGDDRLAGGTGADGLTLGAGADNVVFARGDGTDWVVDFAPGTDRIEIGGYAAAEATIRQATYWGMVGTDIMLAGSDRIFLQGVTNFRAGDVTWSGGGTAPATPPPTPPSGGIVVNGGAGDDNLRGGAGADTLAGFAGSDDLQGLDGDDRLDGGPGHDGFTLGAGRDSIAWARGDGWDWVVDFTPGTDRIEITGVTAGQVTRTLKTLWDMPGLELVMPGGEGLFLQGVTGQLGAADLVFG